MIYTDFKYDHLEMAGKALSQAIEEVESYHDANNRQENCSTVEYLDEDKGALAPIDYTDIAYDKWNFEMSLRVKGVREEFG